MAMLNNKHSRVRRARLATRSSTNCKWGYKEQANPKLRLIRVTKMEGLSLRREGGRRQQVIKPLEALRERKLKQLMKKMEEPIFKI